MNTRAIFLVATAFLGFSVYGAVTDEQKIERGRRLFALNCAHCHGADASGDEGPDLHGVTKSDTKIASLIKLGIKGEMPRFGQKLSDQDVRALVAFIRSLKE